MYRLENPQNAEGLFLQDSGGLSSLGVQPCKKALLSACNCNTMISACLRGETGRIYVDEKVSPKTAVSVIGDFIFFAGAASYEAVPFSQKESAGSYRILIPNGRAWEVVIEDVYRGAYRKIKRYAMKRNPSAFDKTRLKHFFLHVPVLQKRTDLVENEFQTEFWGKKALLLPAGQSKQLRISEITSPIYDQCLSRQWSKDLVANYESFLKYREHGIGFVLLEEEKIVSGASSYVSCGSCIEVEIDTEEHYRRRGFATICGARLIYECLEKGIYPDWDAHNQESVRLAQKLGYEISFPYTAYEICV